MPFQRALAFLAASLPLAAITLSDVDGRAHALPSAPEATATVILFVTHDCPISNRYAPEIRRICAEYAPRGTRCIMAYVDPTLSDAQIREHRSAYGSGEPAVHDKDHLLAKLAGASVTPEAAVFDETGRLAYRGRIDNLYEALGTPRRKATQYDLRDALTELLSGQPVSRPRTQAVGCFIPSLDLIQPGGSP